VYLARFNPGFPVPPSGFHKKGHMGPFDTLFSPGQTGRRHQSKLARIPRKVEKFTTFTVKVVNLLLF